MPTSTSKQATTIQERKQFNNLGHKKRILLFQKNLPASLKKSEFSFPQHGVASCTWDARWRGHIKKVCLRRFFLLCLCKEGFRFVNKVGEVMVYLYIFAK